MSPARIAADSILLLHLGFIFFATLGGFLVLRWPRLLWLHLPCAVWGFLVEIYDLVCPLTPLELRLRLASGDSGYAGGFVDRYLVPIIYPPGLTRGLQIVLALALLGLNVALYLLLWHRHKKQTGWPRDAP